MTIKNSHPGLELQKILQEENISQRDFAAKIGITLSLLNSILKGTRNLNVNIAISLEAAGYKKAMYWMQLQIDYLIDESKKDSEIIKKTDDITTWKEIQSRIPFSFLKKEGYIKNDISQDIKSIYKIYNVGSVQDLNKMINSYDFKHFRKSSAFTENKYHVIGWSKLAEYEASKLDAGTFDPSNEHLLIEELKKCFYKNKDTIKKAEEILKKYGIKFLTLDRPDKTPVDGKSFMCGSNPAIVLTLKYKRLDNFAFTLMHELGHVFLHFTKSKYKDATFFTNTPDTAEEERQANEYARDHLIDKDIWTSFIVSNDEYNDDVIIKLSKKIKVHPGIIRGRVCFQFPEYYRKRSKINSENVLG